MINITDYAYMTSYMNEKEHSMYIYNNNTVLLCTLGQLKTTRFTRCMVFSALAEHILRLNYAQILVFTG